jgi:accessory gene regulator B
MIELFVSESSKILIMYFIFYNFNSEFSYVISLITLTPLRLFTGGLHFEKYKSCFIFSLSFFSVSIISANIFYLTPSIVLIIYTFVIVSIFTCSPTQSKKRPPLSKRKKNLSRLIGMIIVTVFFLIYLIYPNFYVIKYSIWVLFYQALQLIISKGVNCYEKKK